MKAKHILSLATFLMAAAVNAQQPSPAADAAAPPAAATAATAPQAEGEVRRVDLAQGKVTLRHGPLAHLDMPAMTMVFTAADTKLLEGLKQGDKVRFTADKKDGSYVVTAMELAQ